MTADALLDTNVPLRHVLHGNPNHSPRATALIGAIERGERTVRLADTVVFEAAFTLKTTYRGPQAAIRDAPQPVLDLSGVILPGKRSDHRVFDLYVQHPGLSFADC